MREWDSMTQRARTYMRAHVSRWPTLKQLSSTFAEQNSSASLTVCFASFSIGCSDASYFSKNSLAPWHSRDGVEHLRRNSERFGVGGYIHPKARLLVHGLHANSSRRSVFGYAFVFTRVGISSMLLGCRDRPDMVNRFSVLVRFNKALRVRR